jgi:hypothetical protein
MVKPHRDLVAGLQIRKFHATSGSRREAGLSLSAPPTIDNALTQFCRNDATEKWPARTLSIGAGGTPAHRHRNPSSGRRLASRDRDHENGDDCTGRRGNRNELQRGSLKRASECPFQNLVLTIARRKNFIRCGHDAILRGNAVGSSVNQPLIQAGGSLAGNESSDARSITSRGASARASAERAIVMQLSATSSILRLASGSAIPAATVRISAARANQWAASSRKELIASI